MSDFGDLFAGVGDMLGGVFAGDGAAETALGLGELFSPEGRRERAAQPIVYERYLCGGPRVLNVNDR